jgi:hypothetical protein
MLDWKARKCLSAEPRRPLVSRLVSKARPTSQKATSTTMKGGPTRGLMVELRGLEPLTSSMPWKRATNCAKAP